MLRIVSMPQYVEVATAQQDLDGVRPLPGYLSTPPPDGLALAELRRIVGLLRPYWQRTSLAFAMGVAMMVITTVIPLVTRTIIDQGLTRRQTDVLVREIGLLLALALLRWVLGGLRRNVSGRVGTDVEYDLRMQLSTSTRSC